MHVLIQSRHLGRHLEYLKTLNDASWASLRFWFYTTSSTKISNNLVGGYFCKVKVKMPTWLLDYFLRCGVHACIQYSKWGLTTDLYRGIIKLFFFICYISPIHSKNLVTIRRCNSTLFWYFHVSIHCYPQSIFPSRFYLELFLPFHSRRGWVNRRRGWVVSA